MKENINREFVGHRLASLSGKVFAMLPEAWDGMLARASAPIEALSEEAKPPRLPSVNGSIAVLPVYGVIGQRLDWWTDVSTDWLGRQIDELMANPSIGAIVLNIDSPGGTVYGVAELGEKIRSYQGGKKPIYGVANSTAFSAAYWLAAQTARLFVTPSGKVGSIGVWSAHLDVSGWEEKMGVKTTLVSAGKYKVEGHPYAPLDEEARSEMQRSVDYYHGMFLDAVAKGRNVSKATVASEWGEGRLIEAPRAISLGMADKASTLEEVLGALVKNARDRESATAQLRMAEAEIALRERT